MKTNNRKLNLTSALILLLSITALSGVASAQILSVDFTGAAYGGVTQAGFDSIVGTLSSVSSESPATGTFGAYTVTATPSSADQGGIYNRGGVTNGGGLTYANLYNSFVFDNSTGPLTLTIAGVTANTTYALTLFAYDSGIAAGAETFTAAGATSGGPGTVDFVGASTPTTNLQYSTTIDVSSTSTTLTIEETGAANTIRLNGFELSAVAAPEPSSVALIGLGALVLLINRRRMASLLS